MQTHERQSNSSTEGGSTQTTTWWTCVPINFYQCPTTSEPLKKVPTTYLEEMVLPLHLTDNQNSAHWSRTVIGHRVMSSCTEKIHRITWLPKYHHQRQWNNFCWNSQRAENFHERVGQSKDWEWLSTEKDCLEIQSTWKDLFKIARKSWLQSWTIDAIPTRYWAQPCVLWNRLSSQDPWQQLSDDPEYLTARTPNHFLLGPENASAPFRSSSECHHELKKSFKTA